MTKEELLDLGLSDVYEMFLNDPKMKTGIVNNDEYDEWAFMQGFNYACYLLFKDDK